MKKLLLPLALLAAVLAACVPSVNPFYMEKDVISDLRLVGTWAEVKEQGTPDVWAIEAPTNNAYALTITESDGKVGHLESHLFKLAGQTFLDLTPTECDYAPKQSGVVNACMLPGHLLARLDLAEGKFHLAFCDPEWVKKYLTANPKAVPHRVVDGSVVLTGDTVSLQKFVQKYLGKGELFGDGGDFKKQ